MQIDDKKNSLSNEDENLKIEDRRNDGMFARVKNNSVIKKLRGIKNIQIIALIFIIAVGLIIYSSVTTANRGTSDGTNSVMTAEEQRLSAVLSSIDGAGTVEAMITSRDGDIVGVIVIAEGAESITVRLKLLDAAACALGVSKQIVNVYSRKN